MKIRRATMKDVPEIVELWKQFMKEHDQMIVRKNKKLKPFLKIKRNAHLLFKKYVIGLIKSKSSIINVVEDRDRLRGYSIIKIQKNVPVFKIEKSCYFADLYLEKSYRGKGVASEFKKQGIKWGKKKGMKMASIFVSPENTLARKIYAKWGFTDYHIDMRKKI